MFGTKIAWGIDIGESAVRAVKMKVTKARAEVIAIDSIPRTNRADGFNYVDKDDQVRAALTTFVGRNRVGSAKVALSVPGAGFDRFISLPAVSMKQVPQIVKYEARQQIPFPLEEVAWDYQRASEQRPAPGEGIEVALFAIKTQIIQQILASLSVARLGVDIIGMSRLALYNLLKYDRQIDSGTMIVDIGASNTDIVLLADGNFRVRSIPISGDSVTKVLQQKFGISYEEAEELKKKASQSKQPDKMFGVMKPTFDRLLGEIHKTIGYYKQQFKTLKVEQAYLVGESFRMQPLVELFAEGLGCKVSVLSSFQRITLSPRAASSEHSANLPSFAVAIGLALQAGGQGPVAINVLPDEVKVKRELGRKKPFVLGAAACLGVAVAATFYGAGNDAGALAMIGKGPEEQVGKADKLKNDYRIATDTAKLEESIAGLADLGKHRDAALNAANALWVVYDNVPKDVFLTQVKMDTIEPPKPAEDAAQGDDDAQKKPAAVQPTKYEMLISGKTEKDTAYIYNNFVAELKKEDIFTCYGKAEREEMPEVKEWAPDKDQPLDKATNRKPGNVFTIRVTVTPEPPAASEPAKADEEKKGETK